MSTSPPPVSASADASESSNSVQAVAFALRILEYVASRKDALRVTDLAAHFETNKTRIFRHLRTLVETGYIVQDKESERYRVGSRLIALGQTVSKNFDLASVARPPMRVLRDALNHSVVLGLPVSTGVQILSVEPSSAPIEITVRPGSVMAFHHSAQGKVALAFGDPAVLDALTANDLTASTPHTICQLPALRAEVQRVRARGLASAPNEAAMGLNALAAPIFDSGGQLIATAAIVNLVQFLDSRVQAKDAHSLLQCAAEISSRLGYRGQLFAEYLAGIPPNE